MDVWKIIRLCEVALRVYVNGCDFRKPTVSSKKNIKQIMINRVMSESLGEMIFTSLYNHDLEGDSSMEDMHSSQLRRMIANKYFEIHLYNHGRFYNENVINKGKIGIRQQSNKLVLFKEL